MQRTAGLILVTLLLGAIPSYASEQATKRELVRIAQTLLDAIAPGDREVFDRWLSDDFILVDRDGSILRKPELLEGTTPIAKGFSLDRAEAVEPEVRLLGDSAVLVYKVIEEMTVFGQKIYVEYRSSHAFAKRGGDWRLVVWQYVEIPRDAPPVAVDPKVYDDLAGEYLFGERRFVVSRRGDKLFGVRGDKEVELVPESESVFYVPGSEFRKIFVRDRDGRVVEMLDRRKGTDVRWTRVVRPSAAGRAGDPDGSRRHPAD